jgi:hypothetical protein
LVLLRIRIDHEKIDPLSRLDYDQIQFQYGSLKNTIKPKKSIKVFPERLCAERGRSESNGTPLKIIEFMGVGEFFDSLSEPYWIQFNLSCRDTIACKRGEA